MHSMELLYLVARDFRRAGTLVAVSRALRHLTLSAARRPAYNALSSAMALMRGPRPSAALGNRVPAAAVHEVSIA